MSGEDRVLNLRDHGVLIADDARQDLFPGGQHAQQVDAHLLARWQDPVAGLFQVSYSAGFMTERLVWSHVWHGAVYL